MKTLKESILSSNNASPIIAIKNLFKHDSIDDCEELNDRWKMLHLDIKDCKRINVSSLDCYCYVDPDQLPMIWVL